MLCRNQPPQSSNRFLLPGRIGITAVEANAIGKLALGRENQAINEEMITWCAFDADRQLFVAVLARANRACPPSSLNPEGMSPNQIVGYSDAAGY